MKQLDAVKARRDALASDVAQKRSLGAWRGNGGSSRQGIEAASTRGSIALTACHRPLLCPLSTVVLAPLCAQWRAWRARLASCWRRRVRCSSSTPFAQQTLAGQQASQLLTRRPREQRQEPRRQGSSKQAAMLPCRKPARCEGARLVHCKRLHNCSCNWSSVCLAGTSMQLDLLAHAQAM